mgnify:CR=1 FL=1
MSTELNDTWKPDERTKLWMLERIDEYRKDGCGSFRTFLDFVEMDYSSAYGCGGMNLTNNLAADDEVIVDRDEWEQYKPKDAP